jgi:hypothetical protein
MTKEEMAIIEKDPMLTLRLIRLMRIANWYEDRGMKVPGTTFKELADKYC